MQLARHDEYAWLEFSYGSAAAAATAAPALTIPIPQIFLVSHSLPEGNFVAVD
jgi:hypothetical protein